MYTVYAVLLIFAALLAELICGTLGAAPPFLAVTVFYLAKAGAPVYGISAALIAGTIQDLVIGRDFLFTPEKLIFVLFLLLLIHPKPFRQLPEAMIPGALLGAVSTLANIFCILIGTGSHCEDPMVFSALFFNSILAAVWVPVLLFLYDLPAQKMKLPLFFLPEKNHSGNRQRKVSSSSIFLERKQNGN